MCSPYRWQVVDTAYHDVDRGGATGSQGVVKLSLPLSWQQPCVDQVVANLSYYTVGALCEAGDREHVGRISIAVVCQNADRDRCVFVGRSTVVDRYCCIIHTVDRERGRLSHAATVTVNHIVGVDDYRLLTVVSGSCMPLD